MEKVEYCESVQACPFEHTEKIHVSFQLFEGVDLQDYQAVNFR